MKQAGKTSSADLSTRSNISVQRYFEVSLLLMLSASFLTVASTEKLDAVSVLLFSGALGVKLWGYARGATGYCLPPRVVTRLAAGYLFFYAFDFAVLARGPSLMDRLLAATIHLILFVILMKVFSAQRYRDYAYLAVLSFLMMLASAVLAAGTAYLIGLLFYVLFSISMLISYEVKRSIDRAHRVPQGPYREPGRNRVAVENSLLIAAVELALGTAALGAALFFVIPRYHMAYFDHLALRTHNVTGFAEGVELGGSGGITPSNAVVMRVRVHGSPGQYQGVKWRGLGLASFTGRAWYNESTTQMLLAPASPGRFIIPPELGWNHRPHQILQYQILLSSLSTNVLFAAAQPREILGRFPMIGLDETMSLHDPAPGFAPAIYTVISDAGLPSPAMLRHDSSNYPTEIRLRYLSLPPLDARIAGLAQKVAGSGSSNYDRTAAIADYLRQNYSYTLSPPAIQRAQPIASFLFQSRKGYCAYFAASMAVMVRTLGIPSRVVNGFQTGTYNRVGADFIVRARDAHSWVEVYFPSYGWVPFDPTPAEPDAVSQGALGTVGQYLDAASLLWSEWVINYDFARQATLAREATRDSHQLRRDAGRWLSRVRKTGGTLAYRAEQDLRAHRLVLLGLALAVFGGCTLIGRRAWIEDLRLRALLRFGRIGQSLSRHEATLAYSRFLKVLQAKGFKRVPSQSPEEFARSLASPGLKPTAIEFTRLYNAMRFGRLGVPPDRLHTLLQTLVDSREKRTGNKG